MTATRALARVHAAQVATVRQRTAMALRATWTGLPNYRDEGMNIFISQFTPVLTGAQSTIAALTSAYLTEAVSQETGQRLAATGVRLDASTGAALRNGVAPSLEYQRPFETVWYRVSQGSMWADAAQAGLARADAMAATDLQLAATHAIRNTLSGASGSGVTGYLRVAGPSACALCRAASEQRYHIQDLMPIHAHCSCGVEPIFGNSRLPSRLPSSSALEVREHGEIGPVLTFRDQHFKGPSEVAQMEGDTPGTETVAA